MVFSTVIVHLYRNGRFIGLYIGCCEQVAAHRSHDRLQQLAHPHHPAVQRRARNLYARFTFEHGFLAVQRKVVSILGYYGFDDHPVTRQPLFHDARRKRWHLDNGTFSARTFFALGDPYKPLGRFAVQYLAGVITDHARFPAAVRAVGLAREHFFEARQMLRQRFAARVRFAVTGRRRGNRLASRFCLNSSRVAPGSCPTQATPEPSARGTLRG
jgi:hypothetical protein